MTIQLSDCCKATIDLDKTKERPECYTCSKCGRIIGSPLPQPTMTSQTPEVELNYCPSCRQMTNHGIGTNGGCLKCRITTPEATEIDEAVLNLADRIHDTFASAYAIKEKVNHEWLKNVIRTTLLSQQQKHRETWLQAIDDEVKDMNADGSVFEEMTDRIKERVFSNQAEPEGGLLNNK